MYTYLIIICLIVSLHIFFTYDSLSLLHCVKLLTYYYLFDKAQRFLRFHKELN